MAKYAPVKKKKKEVFPSLYGSHASMVDEDLTQVGYDMGEVSPNEVVCKDAGGTYVTLKSRLDNGMADINRYMRRDSWGMNKKN